MQTDAIMKKATPSPYGRRILICDDDPDHIAECSDALKRLGFTINVSCGRASFLQALDEFEPDILLLDMFMPDFDGMEALQALRTHSRKRELAVVIVSGAADHVVSSATLLAKAYDVRLLGVVSKPVRLARLREMLA